MFDLDFWRRVRYYVGLLQAENRPIKYLSYHQSCAKKKNCLRTNELIDNERLHENEELKEYLGMDYMPYFDMVINPLSKEQVFVQHRAKQDKLRMSADGQSVLIM